VPLISELFEAVKMGTFGGHALPGGFFIVFAVWWTVQMFRRYFASRTKTGIPFKSSVTYPVDFICCGPTWLRRWEWEGFFKVFFTLVGFLGEVITATEDGRFVHLGNGQHATMFFFFGENASRDYVLLSAVCYVNVSRLRVADVCCPAVQPRTLPSNIGSVVQTTDHKAIENRYNRLLATMVAHNNSAFCRSVQ